MNKLIVVALIGLFFISFVSAFFVMAEKNVVWSNPSVGFPDPHTAPIKTDCPRDEWNQHFEDYRAGLISKEDMKIYVRSCKW